MYCTNCGQPMNEGAAICTACGFSKGSGANFCENCGSERNPGASMCIKCGFALGQGVQNAQGVSTKTKMTAGLLYVLLGSLGIGDFYLGYTSRGIIKLLVTLFLSVTVLAPLGMWIWSIITGIQCFQGEMVDSKGLKLKE